MKYEIADIMFLMKSIKFPSDHYFSGIFFVKFCDAGSRLMFKFSQARMG